VPFKWLRRRRRQRRNPWPFAYDRESFAGEALGGEWELLDGGKQFRIDHGIGVYRHCRRGRRRLPGDGGAQQFRRNSDPNSRSETAANKITPGEPIHRWLPFLKLSRPFSVTASGNEAEHFLMT
jgi:hypothetical protein